ncbi:MAG: hypothetical protein JOZ73_13265 [Solirubrobacterales bacterium]|nr:hypothetical protein [Solirubrobacterales bacterium]
MLTQHDLERACIAAVEQARVRWQQEAEQQRQRSLAVIAENAAAMRAEAAREAAALAEGTVATMLSMLAGALPALCREHGPHETRILVQHLLPNLRSEPHITIRVHPAVVPALQDDLKRSDIELAGEVSIIGAPLEPGDVRVSWENGSCKRDTRAILTAIQDALAQLGLLCPIEITPERRLELAE